MKKFTFDSTIEEIDVAGEVYKVDFSDEKLEEYQKTFRIFQKEYDELSKLNTDEMTADECVVAMEKQRILMRKTVDALLGFGAFDQLYTKAGSLINMAKLVAFIGEVLYEKADEIKPVKKQKYVNKKGRAV